VTEHSARSSLLVLVIAALVGAVVLAAREPALPAANEALAERDSSGTVRRAPLPDTLDPDAAALIVEADIFSPTRAAPRERYNPSAGDAVPQQGSSAYASPEMSGPLPRLSGVMKGPAGAVALMQADSAGASGRLYRAGDRIGGYRLVQIDDSSVIVTGPRGRVRIRVSSPQTGSR